MRLMMAVAVLALAACDGTVSVNDTELEGGSGGYTLEVRASELEQAYVVIAPDGRTVGGRAAEGASALMDSDRARALVAEPPPQNTDDGVPEMMSLRVPGFEMSIAGEEGEGESGRVSLRAGDSNSSVVVYADEGGPGEADDRAYVRVTGADEEAVRDFISDADELSPEVQAQMLTELGLN